VRQLRPLQRHSASEFAEQPALPVDTALQHREWGPGVVIGGDADRITVLLDDYGYRTLSVESVRESGFCA
jgi:ATP-dependent DNA helicase RecQ